MLDIHLVSPNPEMGISLLSIWLRFEVTRTDGFFVIGKSMVKEKELNFGGPHN